MFKIVIIYVWYKLDEDTLKTQKGEIVATKGEELIIVDNVEELDIGSNSYIKIIELTEYKNMIKVKVQSQSGYNEDIPDYIFHTIVEDYADRTN